MATVRGTCPQCGDVTFNSNGMQIRLCETTGACEYQFGCPVCGGLVTKAAPDRIVEALTGVGVRVVRWTLPAELSETKLGPPISWDDVLAFHVALEGNQWQEELAELGNQR